MSDSCFCLTFLRYASAIYKFKLNYLMLHYFDVKLFDVALFNVAISDLALY